MATLASRTNSLLALVLLGCSPQREVEAQPEGRDLGSVGEPLADPIRESTVDQGISIAMEVQALRAGRTGPTAHETSQFRFTIQATATGTPLVGSFPAAWLQRRESDRAPDADACGTMVETFIEGNIFSQPDVDLNVYTVLVLNDEASISVVDPRFGFGGTKLLTMIPLAAPGYDWSLSADLATLFVSVPGTSATRPGRAGTGQITLVETYDYQTIATLEVGEAAGRLLVQPDQQYLWTAGGGKLVAIDIDERRVAATLEVGKALADLAVSADSRWIFASDPSTHEVAVVDTRTLALHGVVEVGWQPASMDWSTMAGALYVANRGEGNIAIVDPVGPSVIGTIPAEAGLGQLRFAPGGRFGFVVNPERNLLHVFDSASGRMLQTGEVAVGPDQITFSNELAYLRHAGSDTIYMIHLDQLGPGLEGAALQIVDFPAGQNPLGLRDTPAASIVRAPGENAMLIAHPSDRAVYYYKEGMAAPMGQFQNYRRAARAVLAVDRSLKEVESRGVYETSVRLGEPGIHDVVFFMNSPRIIHCFTLEVAANPDIERASAPAVSVDWQVNAQPPVAGEPMLLAVQLHDRDGQPILDLDDVKFVIDLSTPEALHFTVSASAGADGRYSAEFTPPKSGPYSLAVASTSANFDVRAGHLVLVELRPAAG